MKSGTKYQPDMLKAIITKYYPGAKVFLITQTPYKDAGKLAEIQNKITSALPPRIKISNTDIYNLAVAVAHRDEEFDDRSPIPAYKLEGKQMEPDLIKETLNDSTAFDNSLSRIVFSTEGIDTFMKTASPLRTNLVVVYGDNKAFVMDVMNKLNEFRDSLHIQLIGLPSWERFKNLDKVQCNNMNLMYFSTDYYNYHSENTLKFIREFKHRFETEPNNYGFSGFDDAYFILQALFRFDKNLYHCLEHEPVKMLHGYYRFEKTGKARNLENTYWNILRYNNFEIQKLPDILTPANLSE
jgi:hypothetical protein